MDKVYRMLDANINRACEGLRVVEDICRFVFDDEINSTHLKEIRHFLRTLFPDSALIEARESRDDVGKGVLKYGSENRSGLTDLVKANIKRAEEAFRVIEECAKLECFGISLENIKRIEQYRFEIYHIEKEILLKHS
jgi:thiamine-phosphate pyrophosphorylase